MKIAKQRSGGWSERYVPAIVAVALMIFPCLRGKGQPVFHAPPTQASPALKAQSREAKAELQTGIALTRQGHFHQAIPHFLVARGHVSNEFAANFNLALCYVATGQFSRAIQILSVLGNGGNGRADVYNLLAQAYIGNAQPKEGFAAFQQAAAREPESEKLYLFVADACMDHQDYSLGLKVVNAGMQKLPRSSRLHYERAVFFSFVNQPGLARKDFDLASRLAPGSAISYMATAQRELLDGNVPQAVRAARAGAQEDPNNYILLTILGQALIRSGAAPGQPAFAEAQTALEKSAKEHPNYAEAQLALGRLYLTAGRIDDAITHFEIARSVWPADPSVYAHLAAAYERRGEVQKARKMLAILAGLNQEQAAKYKSASPDNKAGYTGASINRKTGQTPH